MQQTVRTAAANIPSSVTLASIEGLPYAPSIWWAEIVFDVTLRPLSLGSWFPAGTSYSIAGRLEDAVGSLEQAVSAYESSFNANATTLTDQVWTIRAILKAVDTILPGDPPSSDLDMLYNTLSWIATASTANALPVLGLLRIALSTIGLSRADYNLEEIRRRTYRCSPKTLGQRIGAEYSRNRKQFRTFGFGVCRLRPQRTESHPNRSRKLSQHS